MKAVAVLITLLSQLDETSSYGRHNTARDDTLAVLFLSAMRECRADPTGVHDHRRSSQVMHSSSSLFDDNLQKSCPISSEV
jgi:hypothetical protein